MIEDLGDAVSENDVPIPNVRYTIDVFSLYLTIFYFR